VPKYQAISAGHEITLQVAKEVLIDGGNAFDAAIAAHAAMFITEPCMASAGAGGMALCFTPDKGPEFLDFFTQTPEIKSELDSIDYFPIHVNFGNATETFYGGLASVAVPGTIAGLFALHSRFATRPMSVLLQPARKLAREGVLINEFQSMDLDLLQSIIGADPSLRNQFFQEDKILSKGDLLKLPLMDDFLEFIAREGQEGFYLGEIGSIVGKDSIDKGGFIRRSDFENYSVRWKAPVEMDLFDHRLFLPNGPSIGGALMALLFDEVERNRGDWIKAIARTRELYEKPEAIKNGSIEALPHLGFKFDSNSTVTRGTSHFNIQDKWGNAISLSSTIGEGAGYSIPDSHMHMNNMMGEPFLLPSGFHSWEENVRLNSMMTPTMVLNNDDQLIYLGGSGGASRIPYMIAQVLDHLFNDKMSLEEATLSGRIHVHEGVLHVEQNSKKPVNLSRLKLHQWDYQSLFFGGVHSIFNTKKSCEAVGDSRRFGVSEVF